MKMTAEQREGADFATTQKPDVISLFGIFRRSSRRRRILKLLLGGSPCTYWSLSKTSGRETEPSGTGWELFRNYFIAKRTYKPDFFLYENNKSMSKAIREKITEELGVEPVLINSALVSAQNRQRLYWTDIPGVTQPEDRGILLRDIIEGYETRAEKAPLSAPVTPETFPTRPATKPTRAVRSGCVCFGSLYSPKCRWRIYSVHGKSPTLTAAAGMSGGNIPMWADISQCH